MNVPRNQSRSGRTRRAWAQPRFLFGAAALALMGGTWAAMAQSTTKSAVAMPHTERTKPVTLADLPGLVAQYGETRRLNSLSTVGSGRTTSAIGTGQSGFNLVETDLTSNTSSDEREPVVSPSGDFIAFTSNGVDSNNDGKIDATGVGQYTHVWIMNRDGSGQRQVTGLNSFDQGRSQRHPTWSPDGNQIAYSDDDTDNLGANVGGSQLWTVDAVTQGAVPSQITFFRGTQYTGTPSTVESPAWSPDGLAIAFVTNYDGRNQTNNSARALATKDIFSIAPSGIAGSLLRLTGDPTTDPMGNTTDDDHPAWGLSNTQLLFFSSNRDGNGVLTGDAAAGRRIWKVRSDGSNPLQVTDPTLRSNGQPADQDDYPAPSPGGGLSRALAFQTNSFLDDTDQADGARGHDLNIWALPGTNNTAVETSGSAIVLTNILSSPKNFADSKLTAPQDVDRAADREPSFSRTITTRQSLARLVFASGRKYAPSTTSNGSTTPSNPYGGDQTSSYTHDIWVTSTQDTTPPALIPQAVGNLQSPVVAPQTDAPFYAPRTPEDGLQPGLTPTAAEQAEILSSATTNNNTYAKRGGLRFAVVLRDAESGFTEGAPAAGTTGSFVSVSFFNADAPQYNETTSFPNEGIEEYVARELKPSIATVGGSTSFNLNVYDDGPVSSGGHEQEANAVAGDGNYYCEGLLPTPPAGDYYIDVNVRDRANNSFTYDNIWGISTVRFTHANATADLFVSDYTCGQTFPFTLGSDVRFANMLPVEHYYTTTDGPPIGTLTTNGVQTANGQGTNLATTFGNIDIWRVLCRGPVTTDVLNVYRPTIVKQIDPTVPNPTPLPTSTPFPTATPAPGSTAAPTATAVPTATAGPTATPTATPLPYSQLTRPVAVANNAVIWATPYAGTAFTGPGTITDPTTQSNLTNFLNAGGRLFVSGRDVAWALSSGGTVSSNTFLNNELAARFSGETSLGLTNEQVDFFTANDTGSGNDRTHGFIWPDDIMPQFRNPQFPTFPYHPLVPEFYDDGAVGDGNVTPYGTGNYGADIITASAPGSGTVTPAYTELRGGTVGQRIQVTRSSGIQSRAVFFSFGFESVNRRNTKSNEDALGRVALNIRARMAANIKRYFKTGSVSGSVYNDSNNLKIPNFLLVVTGDGGTFYVRTDVNGNYSLTGLPDGSYSVSPYTDANGLTSPQGYFGGTTVGFFITGGGATQTGKNLRVIPTVPGGIIGKAVTSNGTFANRADDTPLPNLAVLVRSIGTSPSFGGDGRTAVRFARLTTTNATGDFSFSSVPALAEMEVIFNPSVDDIPAGSNITYSGPNDNYGRRVLPDAKRPLNPIIVPSGDNFYLNDTGTVTINGTTYTVTADNKNPDTAADQKVPVLVPLGPTVSGVVNINGAAASGATVQLFVANADGTPSSTQVASSVQYTSGSSTAADGQYSFADVPAKTQANGGTQYVLRSTVTRDNVTLVRSVLITLYQGVDKTQNINFYLATLTGRVLNGTTPVANPTVTLQNSDGSTFVPSRTAKTNSNGTYTLANVPGGDYTYDATNKLFVYPQTTEDSQPGGVHNYKVFATSNSLTGTSANVPVRGTDTNVTVPDIKLQNNQMVGRIDLQVDNGAITPLSGATVQLLNSAGTVIATTTSGSDGSYGFTISTTGTYQVRATYKNSTVTSSTFTKSPGASSGPTLRLRLRTVKGNVYDQTTGSNVAVIGATVTLKQGTTVVATTTSSTGGAFTFTPVAPGTYTITATKNSLTGTTASFAVSNSAAAPVTQNVYVKTSVVVNPNPTTFNKGSTYAVSFPYETSSNALTRNSFDRSKSDATIAMADAFNYAPMGTNSSGKTVRFYTVSRFNPNTLAYEAIPDNGTLSRGEGYLLQVSDVPANGTKLQLRTAADDASLKPLTSTNANVEKKFYINLTWNSSLTGNSLNGRNLIGFGFDPAKYSAVAWDTTSSNTDPDKASVQINYSGQEYTIKQAVDAGLIYPTLSTIDPATGRTVNATAITAYGGYFVQARKSGVRLLLQFPQSAN